MKLSIFKQKIYLIIAVFLFFVPANSEENKILNNEHEFNFYSGMFDFSDDGKRSTIFGIQHQNEALFRDSFLGTLSPVSGVLVTADNASYFYTGVQVEYNLGKINLTPSFTPGLYNAGDGKDLGHVMEFKSEIQLSLDLSDTSEFGFSYNHISNASLGDKNPGANSYMFNFFKQF
jgi:hypothetical protein